MYHCGAHSHGAPARRAPSYGTGLPLPCAPPRGGSSCFTAGSALPTRTAPRQDLWHRVATALRFPLWGGSCFTSGPAWPTRTAPRQDARLAMAPGCHCQQLLTRAGFAHSHGAPRQDGRLAMAPGCHCLALPLVGAAAASLLTRAGFSHSHTYMPVHGAPARAVAAFLAGSNALPPVLAMSSAGDGARVWRQAKSPGVATAWPTLTLLRSVCTLRRYPKRAPLRRSAVRSVWAAPQARQAEPWRVPRSAVSITPRGVPGAASRCGTKCRRPLPLAECGETATTCWKPAGCRMGPGRDTTSPSVMADGAREPSTAARCVSVYTAPGWGPAPGRV